MLPDIDINPFESPSQNKDDENLFVKFYYKTVQDKKATKEAGEPKYMEREYIDIRIPGKRESQSHPVSDIDRKRFPRHYQAFKDRTNMDEIEGTPLAEWPGVTRSMAEEMAFNNILTVEHLATAADAQISKFMGGMTAKERAKDWVEQQKSEKPFLEMKKENDELRAMVKDLTEVVSNLKADLSELSKVKKKPK